MVTRKQLYRYARDQAGTDTGTGIGYDTYRIRYRIGYADTLFPKKHQYGDTDTIFLIKIKT
jgi:hypothetical protein